MFAKLLALYQILMESKKLQNQAINLSRYLEFVIFIVLDIY